MTAAPRFVVGIDLGTTNCAIAQVDTREGDDACVRVQDIVQLVNPGEVAPRTLLPSFLFLPGPQDFAAGATALPWDEQPDVVVGELARKRGGENPSRLVSSAKSWLSHAGCGSHGGHPALAGPRRRARDGRLWRRRLPASPIWHTRGRRPPANAARGREGGVSALAAQEVLVTVPASFDEEARELTLQAAKRAGFDRRPAARGAAGGLLRVAGHARRRLASATEGRRPRPGVRHRRRHDRLQPDRRRRGRGFAGAAARRRRRSHPARRRQHGPRPRATAAAEARVGRTQDRRLAAAAALAPVPRREGTPVRGRGASPRSP